MSKGGSTSSEVKLPDWVDAQSQANVAKANQVASMGYQPWYGPSVAAMTPLQEASFQNTGSLASAYGMGTPTGADLTRGGMDVPTEYAGGVRGYSSEPIYSAAKNQWAAANPAQAELYNSFFIDPVTGKVGANAMPQGLDMGTPTQPASSSGGSSFDALPLPSGSAQSGGASGFNPSLRDVLNFAINPVGTVVNGLISRERTSTPQGGAVSTSVRPNARR